MIPTTFYAAKGGQGCSTTAAAYALTLAATGQPVALIGAHRTHTGAPLDDLAVILGQPTTPAGYHGATVVNLLRLWTAPASPYRLAESLADAGHAVVIDAGTGARGPELDREGFRRVLVTRSCYLALRHAVALPVRAESVVLVAEAKRSLGAHDVAEVLGAPVVATIPFADNISRAIDAGMFAARLPKSFAPLATMIPAEPAEVLPVAVSA